MKEIYARKCLIFTSPYIFISQRLKKISPREQLVPFDF